MISTGRKTAGLTEKKTPFGLHKLMIFPAVILFVVFFVMPILQGTVFAFTDWNGFSSFHFVGIQNFVAFFSDERALNAVKNTIIFGLCGTLLLNIFGLLYALILDSRMVLKGFIRTSVYLPVIISPLIMGYIWLMILSSENGVMISTLHALGMDGLYRNWLGDPKAAIWVIVLVNLWQNVGGNMIIYLAGLQNVPVELHESALIDGANYLQELRYIKIPLLTPAIRINVITNIIGCMSIFDVIMALTNGGPGYYTESLSIFIYRVSAASEAGYTAAVALIMFVVILIPVVVSFRLMKKMDMKV